MSRAIEGNVKSNDNDLTKNDDSSIGSKIFDLFHTKFPERVSNAIRIDETCIRSDIRREMINNRGYR